MKSTRFAIPLMLVLAASLLGAGLAQETVSAQGASPQPVAETPPTHLAYDGLLDVPHLPSAAVAQAAAPTLLAPEYANWSRLVFQSARNGHDWEVYAARGDGSDQVNLSNNGNMDMHPRLNRGATRVVFASNRRGEGYELFAMNADGGGQTRLTNNGTDDVYPAWSPDGSRIAFQAYRDGQAEIYLMNANGSGQTRLTNYSDYDGQPVWSPDGTTIAFVRNSSGRYRIWVMNADGSNPRQFSGQPSSANPAWSPDGSQIAYDADGDSDGWQEIWLMDAAGGNQRQVYRPGEGNTDAWVGSWSPDGRFIAFTRISFVQQGSNWYWTTAYLDAWDTLMTWNVVRLSSNGEDWNPDWRPTDLQAPTSSMQPLPAQSPGPFTVSWSGTDAGPAGIASYDVQVRDGAAGAWTNWQMEAIYGQSASYPGRGGHTYYFRVRARDNAGNVEAWPADYQAVTTVESIPPTSSVQPLPPYSLIGNATMTWDGQDYGGSSIETFELQCRDGSSGAWQDCGIYSAPGSAAIPGEPGHTIFIRSRAIDSAGNAEAWPPGDGDTHTAIYTWRVSGTVRDNGGAPVVGVTVAMTPTNLATVSGAEEGSYEAYASDYADYIQVALSKAGYGSLPSTTLTGEWPNVVLHGVLPPADNLVRNWGFEEELSPSWEAGGSAVPVLSPGATHTGQRGATLSWPFTPPQNISNMASPSIFSDAAGDGDGALHVLWVEASGPYYGETHVYHSRRAPDGTWSAPATASSGPYSGGARVAVDQTGIAYAVWHEAVAGGVGEVFFRQRGIDGQWSATVNVSNTPASGSYQPWIGLDGNGAIHVIWSEGSDSAHQQIDYSQRSSNGVWSTPVKISSEGAWFPAAAVTSNGEVTIVWAGRTGSESGYICSAHRNLDGAWSPPQQLFPGDRPQLLVGPGDMLHLLWLTGEEIRYANGLPGGPWSAPETVIVPRPGYFIGIADMAVDGLGTVHVAAGSWDDIKYLRRDASNTWSQAELIAETPNGSSGVQLGIGANGTVYATWLCGWDGYLWHDVYFARRSVTGGWSAATRLANNASHFRESPPPWLIVDGLDRAHVLWDNADVGYPDVLHTLYVGTPPAGDSWLRQQVTIPVSVVNPGLSFLYQLQQGNPDGRNSFSVAIQDGVSTSTVFSTSNVTTQWTHQWLNLSPWHGRTITVTLGVQNAADNSPAVVYLDEVTVGSTYPDLWVRQGRSATLPGQQVVQTITYGNRGAAAAGNAHVTLQLPPELAFVSADPPPSASAPVLRWDVGDLAGQSRPQAIHVTLQVAPSATPGTTLMSTANIVSDTPESEQANNTTQGATFVGRLIYLPVMARR